MHKLIFENKTSIGGRSMKKLISVVTAVVLSLSVASMAQEKVVKAATKEKESVRVVKIDEKRDLDVYLQWLLLCEEFREKHISQGIVKFKDFQVIVKCEFNK
jgi:hypothetical protein